MIVDLFDFYIESSLVFDNGYTENDLIVLCLILQNIIQCISKLNY